MLKLIWWASLLFSNRVSDVNCFWSPPRITVLSAVAARPSAEAISLNDAVLPARTASIQLRKRAIVFSRVSRVLGSIVPCSAGATTSSGSQSRSTTLSIFGAAALRAMNVAGVPSFGSTNRAVPDHRWTAHVEAPDVFQFRESRTRSRLQGESSRIKAGPRAWFGAKLSNLLSPPR
jgi:hypothetical protein